MQDSYTVEIFVWSNIEDPTLLSHRYNSFTFNPLNHASPCNGAGVCFEGRISRIVDVNTLDVHGKQIRLVLVDIPERGESDILKPQNSHLLYALWVQRCSWIRWETDV